MDYSQPAGLAPPDGGSSTSGGSGGSGLIAGDPPWVTGVSVASGAGADKTYGLGDTVRVQVDFVEAVEVTGTPRLKIDMDPAHWGEKWASYESGGGTRTLIFAHTVVEPNFSSQGIAVLANSLALNGGTIRAGGADANLAHDGLDHDANHKVNWQTASDGGASGTDVDDPLSGTQAPVAVEDDADSGPPTVTGVSVVSSPASGDTYMLGETIRIRASFSDAVNVTGSPRLSIDMDPAAWGTKQAAYASGGGTSSLTSSTRWWSPTSRRRASRCWRTRWRSTAARSARRRRTRTRRSPTPASATIPATRWTGARRSRWRTRGRTRPRAQRSRSRSP